MYTKLYYKLICYDISKIKLDMEKNGPGKRNLWYSELHRERGREEREDMDSTVAQLVEHSKLNREVPVEESDFVSPRATTQDCLRHL